MRSSVPVDHNHYSATLTVSLVAVLTATALATNYAMIDIPNVKLMDAIVFVAGFLFGLRVGFGTAIGIWTVYGFINPYGQDTLGLLAFLMLGECFYAIAGVILNRSSLTKEMLQEIGSAKLRLGKNETGQNQLKVKRKMFWSKFNLISLAHKIYSRGLPYGKLSLLFAVAGFLTTFGYDVLTNFGNYVFTTRSLYDALLIGLISGVPFALIHEVSNLFFFSTLAPGAIVTARRLSMTIRGHQ